MQKENKELNIIEKPKRFQIICEATGAIINSTQDYKEATKLLLFASREKGQNYTKLYDEYNNKTLFSIGG